MPPLRLPLLFAPLAAPLAAGSAAAPLDAADLARARAPRPAPGSPIAGATPAAAFARMNAALRTQLGGGAVPCDALTHEQLDAAAAGLYAARSEPLDALYRARGDRRALHFGALSAKAQLWGGEAVVRGLAQGREGGEWYNVTRDGKCAEVVMWWTHHLSAPARLAASAAPGFALPLMPADVAAPAAARGHHEYTKQISCIDCHVPVQIPGAPVQVPTPPAPANRTGPQYGYDCPIDNSTGKPTVWYNRTKRCDWDYEPPCQPCEGVGGLVWGPGEAEWNPMACEVVAAPGDVPVSNRTSPFWPKAFTVEEYALLTFPGTDPCNSNFKNSTYTLRFQTTPAGPLYHTVTHTGPNGPSPVPGSGWALPNGNFYSTTPTSAGNEFCACISTDCDKPGCPESGGKYTSTAGALSYDFLRGAEYIGRERITLEWVNRTVVADHWVKGPHHFWMDVATGDMLREWQPFNGHQIYYNWNHSAPDPSYMAVPAGCFEGDRKANISCHHPNPGNASW